jgi:hypothetical protein
LLDVDRLKYGGQQEKYICGELQDGAEAKEEHNAIGLQMATAKGT